MFDHRFFLPRISGDDAWRLIERDSKRTARHLLTRSADRGENHSQSRGASQPTGAR